MQKVGYGFVNNNNPRPFGGNQPTNQPTRITTMTNEQMNHKELINTKKQLNALLNLDTKYHEQLNDIYTNVENLCLKISIEIICENVEKRWPEKQQPINQPTNQQG